jgi:hypothetical protein
MNHCENVLVLLTWKTQTSMTGAISAKIIWKMHNLGLKVIEKGKKLLTINAGAGVYTKEKRDPYSDSQNG